MNSTAPVVSICIPTYGRVEILHKTLDSIFCQNVDTNLFEICISDNSPTDETKQMLDSYFSDKTNIIYSKSTCEGYYNSIEALKLGRGSLLKLHNNYTMFAGGKLSFFITFVQNFIKESPVLFFSAGSLKLKRTSEKYDSFDAFLKSITYFSTWSTSFCIWKEDFISLMAKEIELDKMFPHTSLLFSLTDKTTYIVDDEKYFENQDVGKKGGYNLPETFGTRYLGMVDSLAKRKAISQSTASLIYKRILQFISEWYLLCKVFSDKYLFGFENWQIIVEKLYGKKEIRAIHWYYLLHLPKALVKKVLGKY